jgi:hypothetical protein
MWDIVTGVAGSLLGPIGDAIQGHQNRIATGKANDANLAIARENMAMQKEFAQKGLIWKAEQAKELGLHQSAVLGAPTAQPASVTAGIQPEVGNEFSSFGQAMQRTARTLQKLAVDQKKADIKLTETKSDVLKGQASGQVENKPAEVISHAKGSPGTQAGINSATQLFWHNDRIIPATSEKYTEATEEDFVGKTLYKVREFLNPDLKPVMAKAVKRYGKKLYGIKGNSVIGYKAILKKDRSRANIRKAKKNKQMKQKGFISSF